MRKLIGSVYEIEKHFEILNCFEIVIQCLTGLVFEMSLQFDFVNHFEFAMSFGFVNLSGCWICLELM